MAIDPKQKTVFQLLGVVITMGALAWASVPFYNWFCRVTGFGGVTQTADAFSPTVLNQTITIRFDASQARDMPWEFRPLQTEMEIKIGADGLAFYEAYNPTDRPIAGQASYNVYPFETGYYFNKVACFCFTEQVLMPGERIEMPVSFFVDPEIIHDRDAKYAKHITLSYTFYEIELPDEITEEDQAALTQQPEIENDPAPKANEG